LKKSHVIVELRNICAIFPNYRVLIIKNLVKIGEEMKKLICGIVFAVFLLGASLAQSATTSWYKVSIINSGVSGAGAVLSITDTSGAFKNLWVKVDATVKDQALAVALTATSLDKKLWVLLDGTSAWSTLYAVNMATN